MNKATRSRLTPLTLAAAILMVSCANLPTTEPPNLSVIGIQVEEATVLEQKYRIRVRIQNPNDYDLAITGMKYDLELNGRPFLKGVNGETLVVPRYGEVTTEVGGVSTIFSFVRQIEALQAGAGEALTYDLSGKLSLQDRLFQLPFQYQGRLELPQPAAQ